MIQLDREMTDLAMKLRRCLRREGESTPPLSDPELVPTLLEQARPLQDGEVQQLARALERRLLDQGGEQRETSSVEQAERDRGSMRRYRGALVEEAHGSDGGSRHTGRTTARPARRLVYRGQRVR
ncbi:hypothetical protein [Arhodomonas sp. SL1]|uniref:hypothetical protein n=1 Tax=Arhodomonas sp. SL1 TaxID=3425691 RepID=UPI003F883A70